jgi:tetratricopeptide (TPR) repeat protein
LRDRELVYRHEESAFVGAVEYLFKHDVLREVTYESVLKRLRKIYHGLVADWLINNSLDRIGEFSGLIADHLLMARREELACQYYIKAGEFALLSYANQEAETQFRRGLSLACNELNKSILLEGFGEALSGQSRYEDAIQNWKEAIELNLKQENMNRVACLYAKSARAAWYIDTPRSLEICLEGIKLVEGEPDSHEVALLMHETARSNYFNGKPEIAGVYCDKAFKMAERLGDIEVQADTLATIGVLPNQPPEEGIEALIQAINLAEKGNFLSIARRANTNLGNVRRVVFGDFLGAKENFEQATEIAKQQGYLFFEFFCFTNVVLVILDLCEVNVIESYVQSLEDLALEISDTDLTNPMLGNIKAASLRLQGDIQESLKLLRESRSKVQESGDLQNLRDIDYGIVYGNLDLYWSYGETNWQETEEVLNELTGLGEKGIVCSGPIKLDTF